jgi:hypothetical protein
MSKWQITILLGWAISCLPALGNEENDMRPPREIQAVRVPRPPIVDGKLDDVCWETAKDAGDFSVYRRADVMHREQTTFQGLSRRRVPLPGRDVRRLDRLQPAGVEA